MRPLIGIVAPPEVRRPTVAVIGSATSLQRQVAPQP
jgi:hypothetical protein